MDVISEFLRFFFWLAVAAGVGLPLMASLYILITPTHKISEKWQNFRMSRTRRSLKDRHFRHLPGRIRWLKAGSVPVFLVCIWIIVMILGYLGRGNESF